MNTNLAYPGVASTHAAMMNAPRTPLSLRGSHASTLPLQHLASPISSLHQQRHHPMVPTSSSSSGNPGWTPEEIAERQLRGDIRLNAELFARLKDSANLQHGAGVGHSPAGGQGGSIPTSTAMALQQLQQNEHALAAALLAHQNLMSSPGALTPGALQSAAAAASALGANHPSQQGSMHNIDPALMLRHIQEEQRLHDHLTNQTRLAQQLNSAAAVAAGHQPTPPQQQHHQHSHLHLHMHQQLAVAQAAAQAALGGMSPFNASAMSHHAAAALQGAGGAGMNPNVAAAAAAAAASGADQAQLAALLGLQHFGSGGGGVPPGGGSSQSHALFAAAMGGGNSQNQQSSNYPFSLAANQSAFIGSRERELQAQAAALAGLIPGGAAAGASSSSAAAGLLSSQQQQQLMAAAAAAANSQQQQQSGGIGRMAGMGVGGYLPAEDYLSALTSGAHSQYSAQMAHEHELRR